MRVRAVYSAAMVMVVEERLVVEISGDEACWLLRLEFEVVNLQAEDVLNVFVDSPTLNDDF